MFHRQQRRLLLLALLLIVGIVGFYIYHVHQGPLFNQYNIVRASNELNEAAGPGPSTRTILLWTPFYRNARWNLPQDIMGPDEFRHELNCQVEHRCELTHLRDFLPDVALFDAVLFHGAEPFTFFDMVPNRRSPHQAYVFALLEPPGETKHMLSNEHYFYNMTMSYRLDSDIVWPYMHMIDIETGAVVTPSADPHWRQPPEAWNDTVVWRLWPKKTKMAAWMVSHCETLSLREKLAEALQQHISVDTYGKCGTLSCAEEECDDMLEADYKFHLSFENALCTDYVTEKLYRPMLRNMLPVVYGGANLTRFLPPHSYVDAERFESAEALAHHLQYLAGNVQEYMRYFWWKRYYKLVKSSPYCELCEKLHTAGWAHKTQSYTNIESWWLNSCRFKSKIRF